MRVLATACFLIIPSLVWGQARRAENLMEKEKYETAHEVLLNGMEKDSTDAALPFVLATLYLTNAWPQANLDSAYYFSVLAIRKYDQLDEKNLDKHIRDGFGKTRLVELKQQIDHLSFERAKTGGGEEDFQQFINQHADAIDLDSAIYLRNEQAFLKASQTNTRKSYKYFIDHYKGAKDWQEADERYQRILYNEMTSNRKLKEYLAFIKLYPNSPYYEEAVKNIYKIKAGENTTEVLLDFVDNYPNTKAAQKAIGLLYHNHLEMEPAASFADKYPRIQISDSLKQVIKEQDETLIPVWNNSVIQLINLKQEVVIDGIKTIEPFKSTQDFISATNKEGQVLMGKSGQVFYKGSWQHAHDIGNGVISLSLGKKIVLVHKNGSYFNAGEEAHMAGPFIEYKSKDKWGLKSITGKLLATPNYDSIWFQNGVLFLKVEDKVSPNLPKVFYPALDGDNFKTGTYYDDYEWQNDTLLWVASGTKEALFTNRLQPLVPLQKQRVDLARKGWTITRKDKILNPYFSQEEFVRFNENDHWQIGVAKDSVLVKYNYTSAFRPDSAFLLGPSSVEMRWGDSTFVYITDTLRFFKPDEANVRPLLDQTNDAAFYELTEKRSHTLINRKGMALDLPKYTEISPLNSTYFLLKEDKSFDLYNAWGEQLLENLEGAALINDSTLSILRDQKFGLLRPADSLYMEPAFEKKPVYLTDSLWVVTQNGMDGVVSSNDSIIITPLYEEVDYWTNGLVFLKKDMKWNIFDLKSNSFKEMGIIKYHSISDSVVPTIQYQKGVGIGIFSSEKGIVLRPTYTSIQKDGTSLQAYYLADKYVEEASLHVLLYYGLSGQLLFQKVISDEQFSAIYDIQN